MKWPLVSIIIVNFNGAHYLPACLDALARQTYPADRFEVFVSDNGSTDPSLMLLRESYPWVILLENGQNLGFCSGNNVAIPHARGDFVVLLNNDTAPAPIWLENLVDVAQADPAVGLVTGHLQLFYPQLEVELQTDVFTPEGDSRLLGVVVAGVDTGVQRGVVQYLDGFYGREVHPLYGNFRWSKGRALLGVPVPLGTEAWQLTLKVAASRPGNVPVPLKILAQDVVLAEVELASHELQTIQVEMPASTHQAAHAVEQNTGSLVFPSGAGRDRGTLVRGVDVLYETDCGRYSQLEEIFAGCGASLLMRRTMIAQIGSLDDDFFMYYEDTDISWRAWLGGWKVVYAPQALVPHIHCGTTKEWSPFFVFLTERNRLAMVFKNGSLRQVFRVWAGYFIKVLSLILKTLWALLLRRPGWRAQAGQVRIHLKVLWHLLLWLPQLIRKRRKIQRAAKLPLKALEHWFVEPD
jgi:GT2 family glycosyltransferase